MWNMTLRVCLNRSIFLLFSLSRELSPFRLHEHVLSLLVSKLFIISLHSLYKFHVSCFVFSHFNSLPPASLSLVQLWFSWLSNSLSFNLHKMSLRYQFTISKNDGISLLLVLEIFPAIAAMLDSNWSFLSAPSYMKGFFADGIIRYLLFDEFLWPHIPHSCL